MDVVTKQLRLLKEKDPKKFAEALIQMPDSEVEKILEDYFLWARDSQLPPEGLWRYWVILAGRGFGKLFYPDTDVLTANRGWIKFGDIEIGDKVFDENGKPCNVTGIYKPPLEKISQTYELHFSDKTSLKTCGDHQWITWTHRDRKQFLRDTDNGVFPPENWPTFKGKIWHGISKNPVDEYGPKIRTTQEIVGTLTQKTKRGDLNHCIPVCKPLEIQEKPLPVDPYIYGYWIGDGTRKSSQFTIHKNDQDSFIKEANKAGYKVNIHKCPKSILVEGLITKLKVNNMELKNNINEDYLFNSENNRLSFLQGLMDSDGYNAGTYVEFCSMTKKHAEVVYFLAASLGQKPIMREGRALLNGKDCGTKYRVFFTPTIQVFRLTRKANKFNYLAKDSQTSRQKHRMITKAIPIEPIGGMLCITVDSPNHLWLVGKNLIPTHNTYTAANWILHRVKTMGGVHVMVGQHTRDLRTVLLDIGPSSVIKQCPRDFKPEVNWTYNTLKFPNGGIILGISGDNPDAARGLSSSSVVLDEPGKYTNVNETFTQLDLGLRGKDARMLITGTPVPNETIKSWYNKAVVEKDPLYRLTTGSTFENEANLDKNYIRALKEAYANTSTEAQEIFGQILWDSASAHFRRADIEKNRVMEHPLLKRIVVAVDPAISVGKDSTGIIVGGIDEDGHIYILADLTMQGTPAEWAAKVAEAYEAYDCDIIVAEKNQGGLMVEHTIQSYKKTLPVKLVSATKGKIIRAEPASLYHQQGKIHLVGHFKTLEEQMVEYDGSQKKSPDNYDSFIWCCTELMLGKQRGPAKSFEFHI